MGWGREPTQPNIKAPLTDDPLMIGTLLKGFTGIGEDMNKIIIEGHPNHIVAMRDMPPGSIGMIVGGPSEHRGHIVRRATSRAMVVEDFTVYGDGDCWETDESMLVELLPSTEMHIIIK